MRTWLAYVLIAIATMALLHWSGYLSFSEQQEWILSTAPQVWVWLVEYPTALYFLIVLLIGLFLERFDRSNLGGSELAKTSPRRLRKIAASYQVYLTGKAGFTWDRILFFGAYIYAIAYALAWVVSWGHVSTPLWWSLVGGGTLVLTVFTAKVFLVSVPKHAFLITTNFFTGYMHVFRPGLRVRFPWDRYQIGGDASDMLSMRAGEIKRTTGSTSKDGIGVTLKNWVVQWGIFLPLAPLNIRFNTANIADMVEDPAESFLNQQVFETPITDLRTQTTIDALESGLLTRLKSRGEKDVDTFNHTLEERGGLIFEMATLGPMEFAEDYKEAIALNTNLGILQERAADMATKLGIDGGQAMDNVMISAKEAVSRRVHKIEMDPGTRSTVEKAGPAVGVAMAATTAAFGGRHSNHDEHGDEHHGSSHDNHHGKGGH